MTDSLIPGYPILRAAQLSGLKPAMIDYLCRQEILVPTEPGRRGRGRPRLYSFGDVVMLRVLARLLARGVSVSRLKKGLRAIRKYHPMILPHSLPARYLVTDGLRVFLREKDTLHELDGKGQTAFLFVLELQDVQAEVRKTALRL